MNLLTLNKYNTHPWTSTFKHLTPWRGEVKLMLDLATLWKFKVLALSDLSKNWALPFLASETKCCLNIAMKVSTLSFSSSFDSLGISASSSTFSSGSLFPPLIIFSLRTISLHSIVHSSTSGADHVQQWLLFFLFPSSFVATLLLHCWVSLEASSDRVDVKRMAKRTRLSTRKTHARHCSTSKVSIAHFTPAIRRASVPAVNKIVWPVLPSSWSLSSITLSLFVIFLTSILCFFPSWVKRKNKVLDSWNEGATC